MAGLNWVELHTTLPDHPKSIRLGLMLRDPRAWTYLAELMLWCAKTCPTGRVEGPDAALVMEHGAGWRGEQGQFIAAAIAVGFVDADENGVTYHGWSERAAAHISKLERDASRQAVRYERISAKFKEKPKPKILTRRIDGENAEKINSPPEKTKPHADKNGNSNPNPNPNPNPLPTEAVCSPPPQEPVAAMGAVVLSPEALRELADRRAPESPLRAPPEATFAIEKPEKPPDTWEGDDFWRWAQWRRQASGYIPERTRPHPRKLSAWWAATLGTPGVTVQALKLGFGAFGADPFWEGKQPPYPFNAFMSGWDKYVRPEARHAS